jgi:hypothetical protein
MPLNLSAQEIKKRQSENQAYKAVYRYLNSTLKAMKGTSNRSEAGKIAEKAARESDLSAVKNHTPVIERIERKFRDQARVYDKKTKIRHALGGSENTKFVFAAVTAAGLLGAAAATNTPELAPLSMLSMAYAVGRAEAAAKPEPNKDLRAYAEIKQAQLALKKLKKVLAKEGKPSYKDEINGLFAAGYGNPGGVITHFTVKNGGR